MDTLLHRIHLAAAGQGAGLDRLRRSIEVESRALESDLVRTGAQPAELTAETRLVRGWLAWLTGESVLEAVVEATETTGVVVRERLDASPAFIRWLGGDPVATAAALRRDPAEAVHIRFRPMSAVTRADARRAGPVRIDLQAPLAVMPPDVLERLIDVIDGSDSANADRSRAAGRRVLHDAMLGAAYQETRSLIDRLGGLADEPRGRAHDLDESFERVNAEYFGGAMPRPRLTWNAEATKRLFGYYDFVGDLLMVSRTVDDADVPVFVVDFIVYHELLHKKHGLRWSGSKAHAHTPAFRADERKFARMDEAERWIKRLARRQR
ncbi:MAG: hypothetical protein AB8G96_13105 [Phycisphaerales bacterium]